MAEATTLSEGATHTDARGPLATIRDHEFEFAIIDDTAAVDRDTRIGVSAEWRDRPTQLPAIVRAGANIRPFVTVQAGVERETIIGERTLLMAGCYVGHDTQLGADCEVAGNATIGGLCTIGARVRIGMGANILPRVTIGEGARIGAGSVVKHDVPPGETWVGVPARRIR